jgi:hypothetical protein
MALGGDGNMNVGQGEPLLDTRAGVLGGDGTSQNSTVSGDTDKSEDRDPR